MTLTDGDFEPCTPKKTPRHFQSIADWGACRKTPVAAENHHLEALKVARGGLQSAGFVVDLRFRGDVEAMVGLAVQRRGLGGLSTLAIVPHLVAG